MRPRTDIPIYKLYGEDRAWPTPELLHHESIARRSVIHNWEIRPHRHDDLFQILYIRSGRAVMYLDGENVEARTPCLLMVPPMFVHGFSFSRDIDGHVLTFPEFVLGNFLSPASGFPAGFTSFRNIHIPDEHKRRELDLNFSQLAREYAEDNPARLLALEARLGLILVLAVRELSTRWDGERNITDRGSHHLQRFRAVIEENFCEWLSVEDYAAALGISSTQLNNVCRALTGNSALHLVHDRLILEAKRNLIYTVMTVSEIAYALGFSDPAYFSRFFIKRAGVSPSEFRARRDTRH